MVQLDQLFRFVAAGALVVAPLVLAGDLKDGGLVAGIALVVGFYLHQAWYLLFENVFALHSHGWASLSLIRKSMKTEDWQAAFERWQGWIFSKEHVAERPRARLLLLHSFGTVLLGALGGAISCAWAPAASRGPLLVGYVVVAVMAVIRADSVYAELDSYQAHLALPAMGEIVPGGAKVSSADIAHPGRRRLRVLTVGLLGLVVVSALAILLFAPSSAA